MSNGSQSRFSGFLKLFGSKEPATTAPAASGPNLDQVRVLKQQGRLAEALELGRQALVARPGDSDATVLVAEISVAQGDWDQAVATYAKVIAVRPDHPLAYYKRGNLLKDRDQLEAALADYDRAVELDPKYAYALCNRGFVQGRLGRLEAALDSYDRAIGVTPDDVVALFNRADVLRELKRPEEALASYGAAIAAKPDHLQSYCNRGILLCELERFTEAHENFERALSISTGVSDVYFGRGRLMHRLLRYEAALADYEHASKLNPKFAAACFARGEVLRDMERWQEAAAAYDQALALQPDYAEAHLGRATVFVRVAQYVEAIKAYERALASKPDFPCVFGLYQHAKMYICDWEGFDADVERIVAAIRSGTRISTPFPLLSIVDEPFLHREVARIWMEESDPTAAAAKPDMPPLPRRPAPERLRIGYFSCDFRDHPVAVLSAELFESHDRSRFEITAFSMGPSAASPMRQRLEKAFDRFIDIREVSDRDVALLARRNEIDIAVDLCGHTSGGRAGIFARRAAPVQATYLGYAGTMGGDYFDYLIGDRTVIPPEHQRHFSEKILYLPHCYLPNDSTRPVGDVPTRAQAGLPPEGFVFCSFNNSYKFTPEVFSSWMRMLGRVEHSVLWLAQNNPVAARNLQQEAERRGIDPRRIIFAGRTAELSQHLARLQLPGLFLDTLPYNAHSTAIDALWAGLPLLTRMGESFAGRVAASLLRAIQLPELVTTSIQEYEDLAVELATHPTRLAEIRQRLAHNRLTTPLFDSRSFVRQLEAGYEKMYERYREGLSPDHIYVPPTVRADGG